MDTYSFKRSLIAPALLLIMLFSAAGQIGNAGALGTWTTMPISREHSANGKVTYVKTVRAAKQKAFDRVVFEFSGSLPNYRIEYLKSHFYDGEAERVRIKSAGKAFVQVEFSVIPSSEEQLKFSKAKNFVPKGRLRMGTLQSVTDQAQFEGFYDFLLGVTGRKPFRVSEMSNPARLVIDFKH